MLDPIRATAPAELWDRGIALASDGAVHLRGCGPEGWVLQVDAPAPTRVVWTWSAWRCECGAAPPCVHIVAAACTLEATGEQLRDLPPRPRNVPRSAAYQQRPAASAPTSSAPPPPASPFAGLAQATAPVDPIRDTVKLHELPPLVDEGEDQVLLPERLDLSPTFTSDERGLAVDFTATSSAGEQLRVPADEVVKAWRSGTMAVTGVDGGLAWLPQSWLERHGAVLEQYLAAREAPGELPRWAGPAAAALARALDAPPRPELAGLAALLDGFTELPRAALPADLTASLREYQRQGVDWLCLLRDAGIGALLADDMGLGKTLQTICAMQGRTLVVAPTSTLHNWSAELARFRPGLAVHVYHGIRRLAPPADGVTLTSYALLRLDHELLAQEQWDTLVLDEAQTIKDPTTATAVAAFALQARWRVALSGTPVENRLLELWSLAHFCNPGLLGGRKEFVARYARRIELGHALVASELQARLRPFLLRRRKAEVAPELPPRTDIVLRCILDPDERAVYDGLRLATHAQVMERLAAGGTVIEALELLLRLRQAACHPALVPGQTAIRSSKVDLLLAQLQEIASEGHRALVFSQWTGLLDLVQAQLDADVDALKYLRLDGSTDDRAGVVARFQADDGPPVMLVSLRAGGTGLNLTAADHVYLLDPWWNPAVEDQAADRTHRIGQQRPVFVHRLIAEDTVEEKILELHARKRALADSVIEGAQSAALTRDDLLALLR